MNRTRLKQQKAQSTRRRKKPTRVESSTAETTRSTSTQALRILAQIAMLKRALLAAEDEGLPHKAICDYLHTLSQMAKLEPSAAPVDGDSEVGDLPLTQSTTRQSANIRERLRQAVADIYGISDLPAGDSASPPENESTADMTE